MEKKVNLRELALECLLEISRTEQQSHLVIRNMLEKYRYLEKQERAFVARLCEGTLEYRIRLDYIIDQFSTVPVSKMKPVIRELLRSSVYQLLYMDHVPDSAVCNEAVKLARKKGFYNLTGFVNAVLRRTVREYNSIRFPNRNQELEYLSVIYSAPLWLAEELVKRFGFESAEKMLDFFLQDKHTTVRIREFETDRDQVLESLREQNIETEPAPYVEGALYLKGYDTLPSVRAFRDGKLQVQDVSSMLAAYAAGVKEGDYVIDLCAAPGGKALCIADLLHGTGMVDARDISEYKAGLIRENADRQQLPNLTVSVSDASQTDSGSVEKADVLLADVPCSGWGVIGRKPDIKYNTSLAQVGELVQLQREILGQASFYVKVGGTLIYSTCTVTEEENLENVQWFVQNFPYRLESLDPYLPKELHSETTAKGYLQLLPGVHQCDGFFIARLRRTSVHKNE